ncbi:hypothetical protein CLF_103832, partial [Clonorchis sinensis]
DIGCTKNKIRTGLFDYSRIRITCMMELMDTAKNPFIETNPSRGMTGGKKRPCDNVWKSKKRTHISSFLPSISSEVHKSVPGSVYLQVDVYVNVEIINFSLIDVHTQLCKFKWKPDVDKHKTHHSTASLSRVLQYSDIDLPFIDECWQKDAAHLFCALHVLSLLIQYCHRGRDVMIDMTKDNQQAAFIQNNNIVTIVRIIKKLDLCGNWFKYLKINEVANNLSSPLLNAGYDPPSKSE